MKYALTDGMGQQIQDNFFFDKKQNFIKILKPNYYKKRTSDPLTPKIK